MANAVRKTDVQSGTCNLPCKIGGPVSQNGENDKSYSSNVFTNSKQAVRLDDIGSTNCPCNANFKITSGAGNVYINSKKAIKVGDSTQCTTCGGAGNITSGSSNVNIN